MRNRSLTIGEFEVTAHLFLGSRWPLSEEARQNLEKVIAIIGWAEDQVGIKFGRKLTIQDLGSRVLAVDGDKNIFVDFNDILSTAALFPIDEIAQALLHEAGHIKYPAHDKAAIQWLRLLTNVSSLADFYREEPDKLAHILIRQFGSVNAFREVLSMLHDRADKELSSIGTQLESDGKTDTDIVKLLYQDSAVSNALRRVQEPTTGDQATSIKLNEAFTLKSEKDRAAVRQAFDSMGLTDSEHQKYLEKLFGLPEDPFDKMKKSVSEEMSLIYATYLKPAEAQVKKLANFLGGYSRALEYIADDTAIIHSPHPETYIRVLEKLHAGDSTDLLPGTEALPLPTEHYETHPAAAPREKRAMLLIKRIQTMREMCGGEIDVDAAIVAVNAEMTAAQTSVVHTRDAR